MIENLFDNFKKKVMKSITPGEDTSGETSGEHDRMIAFGVLLRIVAESDEVFLPEEEAKVKSILLSQKCLEEKEVAITLKAIGEAASERIDYHRFTSEAKDKLPYEERKKMIKNLFRVACADQDLDLKEEEAIRKIAGLFYVSHKDYIDAKIEIKNETGI